MKKLKIMLQEKGLVALLTLGTLLAAPPSIIAQTYDVYYVVDRYTDASGDVISECDNWTVDANGNTYDYILPVYAGMGTANQTQINLLPGYGVDITDLANGGGDVIGTPFALPVGGGGGDPSAKVGDWINKTSGTSKITAGNGTGTFYPVGGTSYSTTFGPGSTYTDGCLYITGIKNGNAINYTGCNVEISPLANGAFTGVYVVLGGGQAFPDPSAPSFFTTANWDSVCMGDFSSPFDGSGIGQVTVQCDVGEFESVETADGLYIGCPEPSTIALGAIGGMALLRNWRRRKA
jgi:hypothetical protein